MREKPHIDREEMYRKFWEFTDKHGFITLTQKDLAAALDLKTVRLNYLLKEFVLVGRMKKSISRYLMYDPDSFTWGDEYNQLRTEKLAGKGRTS